MVLPLSVCADDLIVTNESPAFTLDTRLPLDTLSTNSLIIQTESPPFVLDTRLVVQAESSAFTLDTRVAGSVSSLTTLVIQAESAAFTLDTRLPSGPGNANPLTVQAQSGSFTLDTSLAPNVAPPDMLESGSFTLDTRLPSESASATLVTTAASPSFTLDTCLPSESAMFAALVAHAASEPFALDTRILAQNPIFARLIVQSEYGPFTLDTMSGYFKAPAQTLTGGSTSGKARFAPDGLSLAKSDGSQVLMWNLQSIRSNSVFVGHWGQVASLDFSPLGDQLLTGGTDGTFRWWDTASRLELGRTYPPGGGTVYAAYASDGARVLAGRGGNVALYRTSTMELLQESTGSDGTVTAVALAPEGLALAGNSARSAVVWDTATGNLLYRLSNHKGMITAAAFFPGGTNAMTASLDGTIRVWDMATGAETLCIQVGTQVTDAALSLDGRVIASCDGGNPSTAKLWDAQTGALLRVFTDTSSDASQINAVALSPDQTALATTHADGRVRLWNTGLEPRPIYPVTPLGIGTNAPVTLRSHGLYYFTVDAEAARSLVVTLEVDASGAKVTGAKIATGTAGSPARFVPALSPDAEFANLGAPAADKNVGSPRPKSLQTPPPAADITAFRMTATKGHLPAVYDYETFAQASVANLRCEMPVATTVAGKVYVLVFSPYLSAGTINARIRAEYSDCHLSSISPVRGGNSGNVTVCLQGTGFSPDTTARLTGGGGVAASSPMALWADSTKAWFTFPLNSVAAGTYNVEVIKPGGVSASVSNAFQVVGGAGPQLESHLSAPSAVRPGRDYGMTLEYANVGDVDVAAPIFVVSSTPSMPLTLDRSGTYASRPLQIMGISFDGPAGSLPPGARYSIPVYFRSDTAASGIAFQLSVLDASSNVIGWSALEAQVRPSGVNSNLWDSAFANFRAQTGNTWADYLRSMNNQAAIRSQSTTLPYDFAALFSDSFSHASGGSTRRTLAADVDAYVPAPGLPLVFARVAPESLALRSMVGPLGRGWSHNLQFTVAFSGPLEGNPSWKDGEQPKAYINAPGGLATELRPFWYWTGGQTSSGVIWDGLALGWSRNGGLWSPPVLHYDHDRDHNPQGYTLFQPDGSMWNFNLDGMLTEIDRDWWGGSKLISLEYSGGQLTRIQHSDGQSLLLDYNGQGRISRVTDPVGQVTTYSYDASGELLQSVALPGGRITSYTYVPPTGSAADYALQTVTFPDGTGVSYAYDAQGRLSEQHRNDGSERLSYTYDAAGNMFVEDAVGQVTRTQLGDRGQPLAIQNPLSNQALFQYDTNYDLVRLIGPDGRSSEMTYDGDGNMTRIVNPLGQQITLGYAGLDHLSLLRDARGQTTGFTYDSGGNLTNITYPDSSAETFSYDNVGNLTTSRNRRGQSIQYARNPQGQITQKLYPDGRTINYGYDPRGYLISVADSAQGMTSMGYDARGFLASITYPDGKGFTFEYNAAGRRTRRVGHDGYTLNYGYDAAGRLQTLTQGDTNVLIIYTYDAAGQLVREDKGNGTFTTYTYDPAGQVLALTNHAPNGVAQSFFNYTYDAKGNRLTMTTAAGVTTYEYDAINQLTGVTYPGGRHVIYAYDAAGNRTIVTDNGTNTIYTANSLNQYTQAGDATFAYDTDGNMTHRTDSTGTTTYEYDFENRLGRVVTPTNGVFEYTYDALGNRTEVIHDGVMTRYLHDPVGLVDLAAEYDSGGGVLARYDHALGLVSRTDGFGKDAFYSFDALGCARELTGTGGALLNSYDYDAFGVSLLAKEAVANSFRFVGKFGVCEELTHLHFMRARYLMPGTGGFTSEDPFRHGTPESRLYCGNQPTTYIDPSGLTYRDPEWQRRRENSESAAQAGHMLLDMLDLVPKLLKELTKLPFVPENVRTWPWPIQYLPYEKLHGVIDTAAHLPDKYETWNPGEPLRAGHLFWAPSAEEYNRRLWAQAGVNLPTGPQLPGGNTSVPVVRPRDPNDKLGLTGIGPHRVVSTNDFMEYMVRFENMATATAPVQELIVVDYLDANLDWTTVEFEEVAYGDRILVAPAHSQYFALLDVPPPNSLALTGTGVTNMAVNVSGTFNPQAGRLECRVTALDTNTGIWPLDALTGFLPPENGTGRGDGHVKFRVKPKASAPVGTAITNTATIVFDNNDPITTAPVWNIIGDVPSLAVTIPYLPAQITAGMPFTYTIGLDNTGTNPVQNVILTNTLPSGVTVLNATATQGTVTVTNGAVIWDLGTVTNGLGAFLTVTALPSQEGTFANTIYYSGGSGLAIYTAPSDITVTGSTRPTLAIRLLGRTVELGWPTNSAGFQVRRAFALGLDTTWDTITNAPATVGEEFRLQFTPGAGAEFYRLTKP